jgi:3-phenylpropionate/trans-cinnamate dioxygenase ferredoxin component
VSADPVPAAAVVRIGPLEALPPGQRKLAFHGDRSYVVFNLDYTLYAIENSCPHSGASLANGRLERCVLYCPAHGLGFDLTTGCMRGVAGLSLKRVAVRVQDGMVELLPDMAADDSNQNKHNS